MARRCGGRGGKTAEGSRGSITGHQGARCKDGGVESSNKSIQSRSHEGHTDREMCGRVCNIMQLLVETAVLPRHPRGGAYRAWAEEDGQIPTMTWVLGGLGLAVLVMQMVLFVLTTLVRINCTVTRRSAETSA